MSLKVNNKLWLWSDTHFGHKNIIKFQQRPETHETIMLDNWIKRVANDDQILHLGDVFLGKQGNPERWARIISCMPGEKFMLWGNHDKAKLQLYTELAGFTILDPFIHQGIAFTHRPVTPEFALYCEKIKKGLLDDASKGWHTNVHGHVHANDWTRPDHDGTPVTDKRYINVSVEMIDLAPRQLGSLL